MDELKLMTERDKEEKEKLVECTRAMKSYLASVDYLSTVYERAEVLRALIDVLEDAEKEKSDWGGMNISEE